MKNQINYLLLLIFITFTISCSNNDDINIIENAINHPKSVDDCGDSIPDPINTTICLDGASYILPNDVINYAYKTNSTNTNISWVVEGNIEILNVDNTISGEFTLSIATLRFTEDFTEGIIKVLSDPNNAEINSIQIGVELEQ